MPITSYGGSASHKLQHVGAETQFVDNVAQRHWQQQKVPIGVGHAAVVDATLVAIATAARRAVAVAHVARIVLGGAVWHALAVETARRVAIAHIAQIILCRTVWHALAIGARRSVAVAHITLVEL